MFNLIFFLKFILPKLLGNKIVVGIGMKIFQSDFHCIETNAIHAVHVALSDESIRVNRLHYTHNCYTLNLAAHHH